MKRNTTSLLGYLLAMCLLACPNTAHSQVALGFVEDFPGPGTGGWSGGVAVFNNPGTGGVGGAGDGFLYVETVSDAKWGQRCICPEYSGDWQAAGIEQIRLWLNDVGADEPFEIHVSIGGATNFWQYDVGFDPPNGQWAEFVVDLTRPSDFTQIIGGASFDAALQNVDRVLIRHDLPPYPPVPNSPDLIQGAAGIDRIMLTEASVPPALRQPVVLGAPYPNPASGPVTFAFEAADGAPVTLRVVDVSGRRIREIRLPASPGPQIFMWDGRNEQGREVPPGRYRVRAESPSGGTSRPFTRL